ncbi:MAG: hypothetical protein CM1200mP36_10470 [Gammaproteobacteria bacterium]|nr:MAG: hypothetical protein CM1200mP36_10470 [Gammaproteobacteria bacterium]
MASGYWQDFTTSDFLRLSPEGTIALLPVAAIEQHGPHLPLATDALINEAIVSECLKLLPEHCAVLVLPAMTVGSSLEHTAFPGTLSIDADTLLSAWKAIGTSVSHSGIRKLVVFNSHGGQTAFGGPCSTATTRRAENVRSSRQLFCLWHTAGTLR